LGHSCKTIKWPDTLPVFHEILEAVKFTLLNRITQGVLQATSYTDPEDAPIALQRKLISL
jgi:hypothetical protein